MSLVYLDGNYEAGFYEGVGGLVGISYLGLGNSDCRREVAWDEEIEDEARLRNEVGDLMRETKTGIEYCRRERRRIFNSFYDSRMIFSFKKGIPIRHLKRVRDVLSLGLFRFDRSKRRFDCATVFIRDRNVSIDGKDYYEIILMGKIIMRL